MKTHLLASHLLFITNLFLLGCATSGVSRLEMASDQGPAELKIFSKPGDRDVVRYYNSSLTKNLLGTEIVKKSQENIDFDVESVTASVGGIPGTSPAGGGMISATPKEITYRVKTIAANGNADLHDFGVPKLNEEFELKLDDKAQVLSAGTFDRGTIFYVPPISLPTGPVQVGDTWPMSAEWISMKTGVPLHLEIVSILKGFRKCGDGRCAEIEISGDVSIVGAPQNVLSSRIGDQNLTMRFTSEISGRLLFHIERGTVVYQYSKSRERLAGETEIVEIDSCITAVLSEPSQYSVTRGSKATCKPSEDVPTL